MTANYRKAPPDEKRAAPVPPPVGPHPTELRRRHPSTVVPTELGRERFSIAELRDAEALFPVAEVAKGHVPGFHTEAGVSVRQRDDEAVRTSAAPWHAVVGTLSRDRGGTVSVRRHFDERPGLPPMCATPEPRFDSLLRTDLPSTSRWYRFDRHQQRYVLVARLSPTVSVPFDALTGAEWAALVADGWGASILPPLATSVTARGGQRSKLTPEQRAERKREQARERKRRQRERARREREREEAREHDATLAAKRAEHEREREHTNQWEHGVTH